MRHDGIADRRWYDRRPPKTIQIVAYENSSTIYANPYTRAGTQKYSTTRVCVDATCEVSVLNENKRKTEHGKYYCIRISEIEQVRVGRPTETHQQDKCIHHSEETGCLDHSLLAAS